MGTFAVGSITGVTQLNSRLVSEITEKGVAEKLIISGKDAAIYSLI